MIVIDTSALIGSLTAGRPEASRLRQFIDQSERLAIPTLVLYEWLRGPRLAAEIDAQERLLPAGEALAFGVDEAIVAAKLYREVKRPRGREVDLAIAAIAIVRDAALWTLNRSDFEDIPRLQLA